MRHLFSCLLIASYFLCSSCSIFHKHVVAQQSGAAGSSPGTCKIEGQVITILLPSDPDTNSICAKYPCRAKVRIVQVLSCGPGISHPLNAGDTVEIKFEYTVFNTINFFPEMKAHYSGIRDGDYFTANAVQRLHVGSGIDFVIYDYAVK